MKYIMRVIAYILCCFANGILLGCGLIKMAELMFTED